MKEVLREIGMIARSLESISNIESKDLSLTRGQYLYLIQICEKPGIIQDKLAQMIKIDRTTAAYAIKKLEKQGFIIKKGDGHNKKEKKLFPTEKGKKTYSMLEREEAQSNIGALHGFSQEEIEMMFNLLQRVRKNIEAEWISVKKGKKEVMDKQ